MHQKQKGIAPIIIIGIVILVLAIAGASGYYYLINKNQTVDENKNIENLISGNEMDTNDWNTYVNQENGFQVKYPLEIKESDIEIKDKGFETHYQKFNPTEIIFNYAKKDAVFTISIVDRWSNIDLFQNAYSCGDPNGYQKNIEIDGIQGIEVTGLSKCPIDTIQDVDFVYFEKDSKVYILEVVKNNHWGRLNPEEDSSKELIKIFHQMVSTFKFIDKTTGNTQQINQTVGGR